MAPVMLTASVVAFDGTAAGSGEHLTAGPPDTFVTDWDAVGSQAFTAAALSPAEGHTVFAYVAIAVYDSVMAVKGGGGPSHPPPLSAGSSCDRRSGLRRVAGHDPGRPS